MGLFANGFCVGKKKNTNKKVFLVWMRQKAVEVSKPRVPNSKGCENKSLRSSLEAMGRSRIEGGEGKKPAFGPIGVVKIDFGLNLSQTSEFSSFFFEKKLLNL